MVILQSLSTIHSGICTCCFDNFVSTFNIHTAAQLKILAHKVERIAEDCIDIVTGQKYRSETDIAMLTFRNLRDCVQQHHTLIHYVHNMQRVFAVILLGQLLLSSIVICFGGFQFLVSFRTLILFFFCFVFRCVFNRLILIFLLQRVFVKYQRNIYIAFYIKILCFFIDLFTTAIIFKSKNLAVIMCPKMEVFKNFEKDSEVFITKKIAFFSK